MPVTGAGGVDFYIEANPHDLGAERGFREGRAADIAKTDEQHGRFSGHVLRSCVFFERYDISALAASMGNVPRSKRRCSVPELSLIGSGRALCVVGIAGVLLLSLAPDEPATKGYAK